VDTPKGEVDEERERNVMFMDDTLGLSSVLVRAEATFAVHERLVLALILWCTGFAGRRLQIAPKIDVAISHLAKMILCT
jgi:hypothetical protein